MEMSVSDSEPIFYYLIRHPDGEMVGTHRSPTKYGDRAMLGAYKMELTNEEVVRTLEEFGAVALLSDDEDRGNGTYAHALPKDIVSKP